MHLLCSNIHHTQVEVKGFIIENRIIAFLTNSLKLQLEAVDVVLFRAGSIIKDLRIRKKFGTQ